MNKKIIAIIPARGGSKGIPKKNIIKFKGKPLIQHSIEYAQESTMVDEIYVSTDSNEIESVARKLNVHIINRPEKISNDTSTTEEAIKHLISSISIRTNAIIVLLQPTSPIRPSNSLDIIIKKFLDDGLDSLFTATELHPLTWSISPEKMQCNYNYKRRPMRQNFSNEKLLYDENGSVYIFSLSMFNKTQNRLGGKIGYYIFPKEYGGQIDTYFDLHILDSIADYIKKDKM